MKDQGEYRSIFVALADDDDFVGTTPLAKVVFYTLRLKLPATGIGIIALHSLTALINGQRQSVEVACEELSPKWVRRDKSLFWIVNGLDCNPGLTVNNPHHRKFVRSQIEALPRSALTIAFRDRYCDWFRSHSKPIENPSNTDSNGIEITYTNTTNEQEHVVPVVCLSEEEIDEFARLLITSANQGMADNPAIGQRLRHIVHGHANSRAAAEEIAKAGVSIEFARSAVYSIAKAYEPSDRSRQVNSLAFFTSQVVSQWRQHQAVDATNAPRPDVLPFAPAPRRPTTRADKQDAALEEAKRRFEAQDVKHA